MIPIELLMTIFIISKVIMVVVLKVMLKVNGQITMVKVVVDSKRTIITVITTIKGMVVIMVVIMVDGVIMAIATSIMGTINSNNMMTMAITLMLLIRCSITMVGSRVLVGVESLFHQPKVDKTVVEDRVVTLILQNL